MPHDISGKLVKVGDQVTMTFEVTYINESPTACNITMQALDLAETGEYRPMVSCNARLVERYDGVEAGEAEPNPGLTGGGGVP